MPLILDLCSGSGSWSEPYVKAGYDVIRVDVRTGEDVRLMLRPQKPVHGILAAPPCTVFAGSGAKWRGLRATNEVLEGLSVVDACLRFVVACHPTWWVLENPIGWLKQYLGTPVMYFDPCDYGDPYTKRTALWGNFTSPLKQPVEPTQGSKIHVCYGGKSDRTKTIRSITPPGFAKAFFLSNQ